MSAIAMERHSSVMKVDLVKIWEGVAVIGTALAAMLWGLHASLQKRIAASSSENERKAIQRAEKAEKLAEQYGADLKWLRGEQSSQSYKHDQAMSQLLEAHRIIRERDADIAEFKRVVERKDSVIANLETELVKRDAQIASLESQVETLKRQVAALQRNGRIG